MSAPALQPPVDKDDDDHPSTSAGRQPPAGAPAAAAAAAAPPPPPSSSLAALLHTAHYGAYNDEGFDDDDGLYEDDDDHAFGDAFTSLLARVPALMGAVATWADEGAGADGGGEGGRPSDKEAAEALDALCAHPLLPDDVLGGERWLDLCSALPVCLLSSIEGVGGGGGAAAGSPAAAAARLLRFLSPALLAGSGGCADALATVLIPLLNHMAKAGSCAQFSVRRHAEAAAAAAADAGDAPSSTSSISPSSSSSSPEAIALQFALVGLHRLGRQWHLLDPGLGPQLAAAVCALLAAPLVLLGGGSNGGGGGCGGGGGGGETLPHSDQPNAPATAAQALLAWEPDAAWWHRLCAVTSPSLDLAAAAAVAAAAAATTGASPPSLLVALRRWSREAADGVQGAVFSGGRDVRPASIDAVAAHALAGVLGSPALRRAAEEEEGRRPGDEPTPATPLWDGLLLVVNATGAASPAAEDRALVGAAREAARATLARLAGTEVPSPAPPARVAEAAAAAVLAAAAATVGG